MLLTMMTVDDICAAIMTITVDDVCVANDDDGKQCLCC